MDTHSRSDQARRGREARSAFGVFVLGFIAIAVTGAAAARASTESSSGGLVVESLAHGETADGPGLRAGDVLLGWTRAAMEPANPSAAEGTFNHPFDVDELETEQAPRGPVTIRAMREGETLAVAMPVTAWNLEVRPSISPQALAEYERSVRDAGTGNVGAAVDRLRSLADEAQSADRPHVAAWFLTRAADVFSKANRPVEAAAEIDRAIALDPSKKTAAALFERQARHQSDARLLAEAEASYETALRLRGGMASGSLTVAADLCATGDLARRRRDVDLAQERYAECLEIRERQAPGSLPVAGVLTRLAIVEFTRGNLDAAKALASRSLAITDKTAPNCRVASSALNTLAVIAKRQGDYAEAESMFRRGLHIVERSDPDGSTTGSMLNNLGNLARRRGHLAEAEALYRRALAVFSQLEPDGLMVASSLNNLGILQRDRADLQGAEDSYLAALAIYTAREPDSPEMSNCLFNLGIVASLHGDYDRAETLFLRNLEITEKIAPNSLETATTHISLGSNAELRGNFETAAAHYRTALGIQERLAPNSFNFAFAVANMGMLFANQGDLVTAEKYLRRSLPLFEALVPGSRWQATALNSLGIVCRDQGKTDEAVEFLSRAVGAIESQVGRLGGSGRQRTGFRTHFNTFYQDYIEMLVSIGKPEQAFFVLERSRARGLLEMLSERDLVFKRDIPEELDRERRVANATYERTQARLAEVSAGDSGHDQLLEELRWLRRRQEDIGDRIRQTSPRFAALRYSEPLDLDGARRVIEPGTALLAYAVGKGKTLLFVIDVEGNLEVTEIDVGRADLDAQVGLYRGLIEGGAAGGDDTTMLHQAGVALYDRLVAPVEAAISAADRVLVVADGPLHLLPFSALERSTPDGTRYFVEWKPVTSVLSMTVYSELRSERRGDAAPAVVVFADPEYPEGDRGESALRLHGRNLTSLPASRSEAEAIAELFGPTVSTWLGAEATETRAKTVDRSTDILHFAAHVVLNEDYPLDSAIVLSHDHVPVSSGEENGFLQAWEVLESVRIDADLVTLSGCDTATGNEQAGEGLIGLTRAFQYAGARTVLASLWRVEDDVTSDLMRHFYSNLKGGLRTDEALREAQLAMIRGSDDPDLGLLGSVARWFASIGSRSAPELDSAHPFCWAAFKLEG